jgi:uncharacterized Fe-S radical SAM superfamily protein PflX
MERSMPKNKYEYYSSDKKVLLDIYRSYGHFCIPVEGFYRTLLLHFGEDVTLLRTIFFTNTQILCTFNSSDTSSRPRTVAMLVTAVSQYSRQCPGYVHDQSP